mmetsp:Transcript_19890/g.45945  ORF Transcript_19890/g.45945 Transcript_19890/m.45945 type:complete len:83 (+) Transcript_19890:40-288(+)
MPGYEEMPRDMLIRTILDMQRSLADITRRLESVVDENSLLHEESTMLKDAIDARIEAAGTRQKDKKKADKQSLDDPLADDDD